LEIEASYRDALEAWLQVGVRLKELALDKGGYALRGSLARGLAAPENDGAAAFLEEVMSLHYSLIRRLPGMLTDRRLFTLADLDGELIARSSRIMEPLVFAAIDEVIPPTGGLRLLEIGCGSGTYIRYAAERNRELSALGIELDPRVAAAARESLKAWGLEGRAAVEAGDIRSRTPEPEFDVATLHNNIYYFPFESRPGLLAFIRGFLKPGGRLLLTTGCRGGSIFMEMLNLWGAATEGCGRLPTPAEMVEHLSQGGFMSVQAIKLYPFDSYYSFVGTA
jgi:SAM-dependent methyltransferase